MLMGFLSVFRKTYTTENAYRSHIISKKHKENELKAAAKARTDAAAEIESEANDQPIETPAPEPSTSSAPVPSAPTPVEPVPTPAPEPDAGISMNVDAEADEDDVNATIDAKIAAARSRLSPTHCLFCPTTSASLDDNLSHMSTAHSFFVPDAEYLVDLPGLLAYLGEKVAVGNVCVYCNGRGREFRTLDAVRKHMLDKGHCKLAYEEESDRLEYSDFYDFSSSYPDAEKQKERAARRAARKAEREAAKVAEEWQDVDEDADADAGSADEVVEESASASSSSDEDTESESDDEDFPENELAYGDSHLELVLPSGARIGHRSMRRYYAQSFPGVPRGGKPEDPDSGRALVRRLLADKNSALVPRRGGFGAFGMGTEVVKARNRGEARNAGRHIREHRDQKRREDYKTRVGFVHNHQKHYRDPLLQ